MIIQKRIISDYRIELCAFSGFKIYPGHGRKMVRTDGKVSPFMYRDLL